MSSLAVTVVGHDRPGIVAEVTAAIAGLGGNLEDCSMSLLRGRFAMMLVAELPSGAAELDARLSGLRDEGLTVSVIDVAPEEPAAPGVEAVLSVHGGDRPGIVSAAAAAVAGRGGNITDLATRLGASMYVMTADVTFPPGTDLALAADEVAAAVEPLGVHASLRPADADVL